MEFQLALVHIFHLHRLSVYVVAFEPRVSSNFSLPAAFPRVASTTRHLLSLEAGIQALHNRKVSARKLVYGIAHTSHLEHWIF